MGKVCSPELPFIERPAFARLPHGWRRFTASAFELFLGERESLSRPHVPFRKDQGSQCSLCERLCCLGRGSGLGMIRSRTRQRRLALESGWVLGEPGLCLRSLRFIARPANQFLARREVCRRAMAPERAEVVGTFTVIPSQRTIRLSAFCWISSTRVPRGS